MSREEMFNLFAETQKSARELKENMVKCITAFMEVWHNEDKKKCIYQIEQEFYVDGMPCDAVKYNATDNTLTILDLDNEEMGDCSNLEFSVLDDIFYQMDNNLGYFVDEDREEI